jgi:hypothetical protein
MTWVSESGRWRFGFRPMKTAMAVFANGTRAIDLGYLEKD